MKNRRSNYIFVIAVPGVISILTGIIFDVSDYLIAALSVVMYGIFSYFCLDKRQTEKTKSREKAIKNIVISIFIMILSMTVLIWTKIFPDLWFGKNVIALLQVVMALVFSVSIMSLYWNWNVYEKN